MGLLTAHVADSVAFEILGEVVTVVADDSGRLEQIETLLEETDHRIDPTGALRHEYYAELTLTRNIDRYGGGIAWLKRDLEESDEVGFESTGSQPLIRSGLPQSVIAQAFQARYEEYWHEVFDVISNSGSPPRGWGMQVSKISDKWRVEPNLSTAMLRQSIGFISVVDSRLMEHDARQNVALAFVRAMRGRAEGNTAPAALGSEPASVDPFNSGQPLGFFFSDDEVRVWSVGANLTDENGEYADENRGDLVMVWPISRLVEYRKKP
jgi:hypothetical protein